MKQKVLIDFLKDYINDSSWKIKAEYSTNDNDTNVIVVQEQTGSKVVFYDSDIDPIYNYYQIQIYGSSIEEEKNMALSINELIGTDNQYTRDGDTYQILIKQFSNFQAVEYMDIRRVGYTGIMLCIIGMIEEGS